jgi:DNA polymerase III epsilon subunit-like protein
VLTSAGAVQKRSCVDFESQSVGMLAVIDVETTGLDPASSRTVECAIVTCDLLGHVVDEWSSLIAIPGIAEIGANWLHGITRATLDGAPTFAELAVDIATRLQGKIVVGHVVAFDLAHLHTEFARIGWCLPDLLGATICTRDLARDDLPPGSHTLAAVCSRLGVVRMAPHTALGDARATASVLSAIRARLVEINWNEKLDAAQSVAWPTNPATTDTRTATCGRGSLRPSEIRYADF